jgi:hypothetical protein
VFSAGIQPKDGPDQVPGTGVETGRFADPEGHRIGVMRYTA